jgi:hypothetical protein
MRSSSTSLTVAAFLCLMGRFAFGQEDRAKQKAIDQMRQIANAMKQCPEQETNTFQDKCHVRHSAYAGPPTNLEWDVVPSKTVRSPFQGIVEFTLPSRQESINPPNQTQKAAQDCYEATHYLGDPATLLKMAEEEREKGPEWREGHYRYEFDVGSDAPELVKMLWVAKDRKNNVVESPATGGYPAPWPTGENECWVRAARSIRPLQPNTQPWNRTAIEAEFVELAPSNEEGRVNLWFTLTNTTDSEYRVDRVDQVTTAGWTVDDQLYAFNQGVSFDVPLIAPAHQKTKALVHVNFPSEHLTVPDDASKADVAAYRTKVMAFLRSEYAGWRGIVILDDRTHYQIDFPLLNTSGKNAVLNKP